MTWAARQSAVTISMHRCTPKDDICPKYERAAGRLPTTPRTLSNSLGFVGSALIFFPRTSMAPNIGNINRRSHGTQVTGFPDTCPVLTPQEGEQEDLLDPRVCAVSFFLSVYFFR